MTWSAKKETSLYVVKFLTSRTGRIPRFDRARIKISFFYFCRISIVFSNQNACYVADECDFCSLLASGNWSLFYGQPSVIFLRHRERKFFFVSVRNLILCKHIKLLILKFSIPCILYVSIHLFNYCDTNRSIHDKKH